MLRDGKDNPHGWDDHGYKRKGGAYFLTVEMVLWGEKKGRDRDADMS